MAKYDSFVYTGQCPYLKSPQSIRVETSEIHILGNLSPGYKRWDISATTQKIVHTLMNTADALYLSRLPTNHAKF